MSRSITGITRHFNRWKISPDPLSMKVAMTLPLDNSFVLVHRPVLGFETIASVQKTAITSKKATSNNIQINTKMANSRIELPSFLNPDIVYNLPLDMKVSIVEPLSREHILHFPERIDQSPISEQDNDTVVPLQATGSGNRMLRIRKRKMKWHKLKKRYRKNKTALLKRFDQFVAKKDAIFKSKCLSLINEAREFDAAEYAKMIRERAEHNQKDKTTDRFFVPLKKHPPPSIIHWTEKTSIDELYTIPPSNYIDKRTGYPHPEEYEEKIVKKRASHIKEYKNPHYNSE